MSDTPSSKVSPIVAIAAVSIIIFSAVGVGVMTGIIPSSSSKTAETAAPATPPPTAAAEAPAPAPEPAAAPVPAEKPKVAKAAPKKPASAPVHVASAEPARAPEPPAVAQVCTSCGSVISVNEVKHKGEGSGLGAVAGGVLGGVLGNQVGRGTGRTVATVIGAAGGAYAGHEVERNVKSTETYNVAVRMDDGSTQNFSFQSEPSFRAGDKVKVVDGRLVAN